MLFVYVARSNKQLSYCHHINDGIDVKLQFLEHNVAYKHGRWELQHTAITDFLMFTFTWLLITHTWFPSKSHSPTVYKNFQTTLTSWSIHAVFLYQSIPNLLFIDCLSDPISGFHILLLNAIVYVVCTSPDPCVDFDTVCELCIGFVCNLQ